MTNSNSNTLHTLIIRKKGLPSNFREVECSMDCTLYASSYPLFKKKYNLQFANYFSNFTALLREMFTILRGPRYQSCITDCERYKSSYFPVLHLHPAQLSPSSASSPSCYLGEVLNITLQRNDSSGSKYRNKSFFIEETISTLKIRFQLQSYQLDMCSRLIYLLASSGSQIFATKKNNYYQIVISPGPRT